MKQKKSFWISLFVAGACILAGLACIAVGHAWGGHRFMKDNTESKEYTVTEDFQYIRVDTVSADVSFVLSEDGACRVATKDDERMNYTVEVIDATLTVTAEVKEPWYKRPFSLFGGGEDASVTVYLPAAEYESLTVKTTTGGIKADGRLDVHQSVMLLVTTGDIEWQGSAGRFHAKATTGEISLENVTVAEAITIETSTGDIALTGVTGGSLDIHATTGDIELVDSAVTGQIAAEVTTGEMTLTRVTCDELNIQTTSGRIKLTDTVASGHIRAKTGSGAIRLEGADAATLSLKTTSGSVTGSLATPKVFYTDTTSGSVDVPKSTEGGLCEIMTTSGSIRLTVETE